MPYLSINVEDYVLNVEENVRKHTNLMLEPMTAQNAKKIKRLSRELSEYLKMLSLNKDRTNVSQHNRVVAALKYLKTCVDHVETEISKVIS
jgi:lipid II:glycine glycyltransferase (peptidoglycan interpeptide bridge formation enzyme)